MNVFDQFLTIHCPIVGTIAKAGIVNERDQLSPS